MLIDEAMGKTLVLLLMTVLSASLVIGSRHQPFPEISGRFGWLLASITGLLWMGEQAPRPMSIDALLVVTLGLGSYGISWVFITWFVHAVTCSSHP